MHLAIGEYMQFSASCLWLLLLLFLLNVFFGSEHLKFAKSKNFRHCNAVGQLWLPYYCHIFHTHLVLLLVCRCVCVSLAFFLFLNTTTVNIFAMQALAFADRLA